MFCALNVREGMRKKEGREGVKEKRRGRRIVREVVLAYHKYARAKGLPVAL